MLRQFLNIIWWSFRIGVMAWFLLMPVLPIYGWLSPWPAAEQKLEAEGVKGIKLMIGAGGSSEREDGRWSDERQRSYIVLPASLRSMEIFTYREISGSQVAGVDRELVRSRWVVPLLLFWIAAGWFSVRTVIAWITKSREANKSLHSTATAPSVLTRP